MSLLGRIAIRGSTVTVKRATKSASAGGATNQSWAAVSGLAGVKMLLDEPTTETVVRVFGQEAKCEVRAFCAMDFDVRKGDGIQVTAGAKAGLNFQVDAVRELDQGAGSRHRELALISTPEAFA